MSAPRKFDQEMRDRAARMYRDRLEQHQESKLAARRQVGALLDINAATIRNWVEDAERREGSRVAVPGRVSESDEVRTLKAPGRHHRQVGPTSGASGTVRSDGPRGP